MLYERYLLLLLLLFGITIIFILAERGKTEYQRLLDGACFLDIRTFDHTRERTIFGISLWLDVANKQTGRFYFPKVLN